MNRILDVDPVRRRAVVQPGVVNARLSEAVSPLGLHYVPDPSSQAACTVGGNVAENAGGPHCLKYGVTTNHIVALEVVLPDGSITRLGSDQGEPWGPDLVGLFVGSEGMFGIATEITVRLERIPESVRTMLADFATVRAASEAVSAIIAAGHRARCAGDDGPGLRRGGRSLDLRGWISHRCRRGAAGGAGWSSATRYEPRPAMVEQHSACYCGAREVRSASTAGRSGPTLAGSEEGVRRHGPHRSGPRSTGCRRASLRLFPPSWTRSKASAAHYDFTISNVFHAGDGNLHPNISFDRRDPAVAARVRAACREIMAACVAVGGSITGEHGVGNDKLDYMPWIFDADTLAAMRAVRRAFDPAELANPGQGGSGARLPGVDRGAGAPARE